MRAFVGDFASDSVKDLVVPHLLSSSGWRRVECLLSLETAEGDTAGESAGIGGQQPAAATTTTAAAAAGLPAALTAAVRQMYAGADGELIELCRREGNDYASSTSVTAVLAGGFLAIGHLVRRESQETSNSSFLSNLLLPLMNEDQHILFEFNGDEALGIITVSYSILGLHFSIRDSH